MPPGSIWVSSPELLLTVDPLESCFTPWTLDFFIYNTYFIYMCTYVGEEGCG